MIWTKLQRVFKGGVVNFFRNGTVSLATVLVGTLTLFVIGSLIFGRAVLLHTLDVIENKVDISVYFKTDADEEDILAMKQTIEGLSEVKSVEYISKEKSLEDFKIRHQDNELTIQSLEEIDYNPFGAMLNIRAKQTSQYETIADFLKAESQGENSMIDKTNYFENKRSIDRLAKIFDVSRSMGMGVSLALLIVAFLVTFNTISLAIYTSREEIGVMRLVGASNKFISGPFVVEGILVGFISTVLAMIIFYPLVFWLGPKAASSFDGLNLLQYYLSNFFELFGVLLLTGVFIGAFSSAVAIRKHLKV